MKEAHHMTSSPLNDLERRGTLCALMYMTRDHSDYRRKVWHFWAVLCVAPRIARWHRLSERMRGEQQ